MNKTKFLQGDSRWGGLVYPKKPCYIRNVGCGEVSIANILIEMEQYKNYTPATIQPYCKRYGAPNCDGTYLTGIASMMKHYGFTDVKDCPTMADLWKELAKGDRVAVYLMGSRLGGSKKIRWTSGGHFVASVDYKVKDGKHYLYVKDPWTDNKNRNGWITYEENMKNDIVQVTVGKLSGLKITDVPAKDGKLTVDGIGGTATVRRMQRFFGTNANGIISGQMKRLDQYYPSLTAVDFDKNEGGSLVVKALQKWLDIERDGIIGKGTTAAWQKRLRDLGYLKKSEAIDGIFGVKSMKAWQKLLNDYEKVGDVEMPREDIKSGGASTVRKTVFELAQEVLDGKWGNGDERKRRLTEAGYNYDAVQKKVNAILSDPLEKFRYDVVTWAKKIAKDNSFIYVHWKKSDPKTKQCPICHNFPKGKYHGWYCTRFPYSAWKHGGGLNIKCDNAPNNGKIDKIYKAKTNAEALKLARKYFKVHDIEVIRNKKGAIPQSKLKPADSCYYFSGGSCQHAFLYIGNGKMIDANSLKDGIAVRKAMSCRVAIRYIGK